MRRFAFIGHYLSSKHFCELIGWPGLLVRRFPSTVQREMIGVLPPYKMFDIPPILATDGTQVEGFGIIASLLPEHAAISEKEALKKVIRAGSLAERLGAELIGLAGFTSVVGNEGEEVSRQLDVAVTSGNTLTASLTAQGLERAAEIMGRSLADSTLAIVGATGDIGSGCARFFAGKVGSLRLAARNEARVEEFAGSLRKQGSEVHVTKYVRDAIRDADLILTATSAITTIIDPALISPGAIICDVALPHNVGDDVLRCRDDVLVFEGGLARMPLAVPRGQAFWRHLSPDGETIFGCLAETIVLSLEGRMESYSIGRGNITTDRISEMSGLARKHGFELADFRYRNILWSPERIRNIAKKGERSRRSSVESMSLTEMS